MKPSFIFRAVTLSAVLAALCSPVLAGSGLVVPERTFHAGRVQEGTVVEHTFLLENRGTRTIALRDVKPDCGCTTAEFDKAIAPGEEGRITLRLDTQGFPGSIAKHTRVFTDDPDQSMLVLTLEAEVWSPLSISQGYVVFKGTAGETLTETIDIRAELERPLELEAQAFDLADKVAFRIEEVEPGRHYKLHFESLPVPPQRYHGTLRIETNYPEAPEIEIRIRARIRKGG